MWRENKKQRALLKEEVRNVCKLTSGLLQRAEEYREYRPRLISGRDTRSPTRTSETIMDAERTRPATRTPPGLSVEAKPLKNKDMVYLLTEKKNVQARREETLPGWVLSDDFSCVNDAYSYVEGPKGSKMEVAVTVQRLCDVLSTKERELVVVACGALKDSELKELQKHDRKFWVKPPREFNENEEVEQRLDDLQEYQRGGLGRTEMSHLVALLSSLQRGEYVHLTVKNGVDLKCASALSDTSAPSAEELVDNMLFLAVESVKTPKHNTPTYDLHGQRGGESTAVVIGADLLTGAAQPAGLYMAMTRGLEGRRTVVLADPAQRRQLEADRDGHLANFIFFHGSRGVRRARALQRTMVFADPKVDPEDVLEGLEATVSFGQQSVGADKMTYMFCKQNKVDSWAQHTGERLLLGDRAADVRAWIGRKGVAAYDAQDDAPEHDAQRRLATGPRDSETESEEETTTAAAVATAAMAGTRSPSATVRVWNQQREVPAEEGRTPVESPASTPLNTPQQGRVESQDVRQQPDEREQVVVLLKFVHEDNLRTVVIAGPLASVWRAVEFVSASQLRNAIDRDAELRAELVESGHSSRTPGDSSSPEQVIGDLLQDKLATHDSRPAVSLGETRTGNDNANEHSRRPARQCNERVRADNQTYAEARQRERTTTFHSPRTPAAGRETPGTVLDFGRSHSPPLDFRTPGTSTGRERYQHEQKAPSKVASTMNIVRQITAPPPPAEGGCRLPVKTVFKLKTGQPKEVLESLRKFESLCTGDETILACMDYVGELVVKKAMVGHMLERNTNLVRRWERAKEAEKAVASANPTALLEWVASEELRGFELKDTYTKQLNLFEYTLNEVVTDTLERLLAIHKMAQLVSGGASIITEGALAERLFILLPQNLQDAIVFKINTQEHSPFALDLDFRRDRTGEVGATMYLNRFAEFAESTRTALRQSPGGLHAVVGVEQMDGDNLEEIVMAVEAPPRGQLMPPVGQIGAERQAQRSWNQPRQGSWNQPRGAPRRADPNQQGPRSPPSSSLFATTGQGNMAPRVETRTCYVCGKPGHLAAACPHRPSNEINQQTGAILNVAQHYVPGVMVCWEDERQREEWENDRRQLQNEGVTREQVACAFENYMIDEEHAHYVVAVLEDNTFASAALGITQ